MIIYLINHNDDFELLGKVGYSRKAEKGSLLTIFTYN